MGCSHYVSYTSIELFFKNTVEVHQRNRKSIVSSGLGQGGGPVLGVVFRQCPLPSISSIKGAVEMGDVLCLGGCLSVTALASQLRISTHTHTPTLSSQMMFLQVCFT